MKVIIQLQYSLKDSIIFHDVKNITQSTLHPTQPNPWNGWTQPMTNSANTGQHYLRQGGYVFISVCLSVCLFVC